MKALSRLLRTTAFALSVFHIGVFVLLGGAMVAWTYWQANELLTARVLRTINIEAEGLRLVLQSGGAGALKRAVMQRSRSDSTGLYFLADKNGVKVAGNLDRLPPELGSTPAGGVLHYEQRTPAGVTTRLAAGVPIAIEGRGTLFVGRDMERERTFAVASRRLYLIGFAALSLLGLAGGLYMSRKLLARVAAVTDTGQTIMAGDLSQRLPVGQAGDELDRLSQSVNAMLARIEQLMAGLREVSDNIAHDLKTPLTRLRNGAEAALRDQRGSAAHRDGLEHAIKEADDLINTFNALLSIARLEAGSVAEGWELADVGAIVRDVTELYEPVAEDAGFELRTGDIALAEIRVNRQLIGQAVANLFDNAIKYGVVDGANPAGLGASSPAQKPSSIMVEVLCLADSVEISVSDHGPGIAEEDRERALDRFVRLEASRSKSGTGLGLSLVAAVARQHGGSMRLEDNEPGLRAVLSLPLLHDAESNSLAHRKIETATS